jgi:hypothetical protein
VDFLGTGDFLQFRKGQFFQLLNAVLKAPDRVTTRRPCVAFDPTQSILAKAGEFRQAWDGHVEGFSPGFDLFE